MLERGMIHEGQKYFNPYLFDGFIFEEFSEKIHTFGSNFPIGGISKGLHIYDYFTKNYYDISLSLTTEDNIFIDCMGNKFRRNTLSQALIYAEGYLDQKERTNARHTKKWKDKANAFKLGKVCCNCGSDKLLAVHHISNEDYYNLTDKNCIVLCKGCHYLVHHGRQIDRINLSVNTKGQNFAKHSFCETAGKKL